MVNDSADVTSSGRSFQVCGPATRKALCERLGDDCLMADSRRYAECYCICDLITVLLLTLIPLQLLWLCPRISLICNTVYVKFSIELVM